MTARLVVGAISADANRLATHLVHRLLGDRRAAPRSTVALSALVHPRKTSLLRFTRMLARASEQSGHTQLGLDMANASSGPSYSIFGSLFLYAPTVRDALLALCKYFPAVQTGTMVELGQTSGIARLVYNIQDPLVGDRIQDAAYTLGKMHRSLARSAGQSWALDQVTLAAPAPRAQEPYRRFFQAPVSFDAASTALHFSARLLDCRIATAHNERYGQFCAHLERLMVGQDDADQLEDALRAWVADASRWGDATLERAAADFGVTPRTMQRRLKAQSISFQPLLARVRMEEAQRTLAESQLPVTHIAEQLGFSETSAFTRAFRSYTQQSPRAFRQSLLALS